MISFKGALVGDGAAPPATPVPPLQIAALDDIAAAIAAETHPLNRAAAVVATPILLNACQGSGITDPAHLAYVLATAEHETNFGRTMTETWIPSGRPLAYENNGANEQPGDGRRYLGRGYVQLTFRSNYLRFGAELGLDLVGNPELAAQPPNAALVMAVGMGRLGYRSSKLILKRYGFGQDVDFEAAREIVNADRDRFEARYDATIGVGVGRQARRFFAILSETFPPD